VLQVDAVIPFRTVQVICSGCGTEFDIPEKHLREKVNCTRCGAPLEIPAAIDEASAAGVVAEDERSTAPAVAEAPVAAGAVPAATHTPSHEAIEAALAEEPEEKSVGIICPKCKTAFEVPESYRGEQVQCSDCNAIFLIPAMGSIGVMVECGPAEEEEASVPPEPPDAGRGSATAPAHEPGPGAQEHKESQFKDSRTAKISIADLKNTMKPTERKEASPSPSPLPPLAGAPAPAPAAASGKITFRRK